MAKFRVGERVRWVGSSNVHNEEAIPFVGRPGTVEALPALWECENFGKKSYAFGYAVQIDGAPRPFVCAENELEPLQKRPELGSWDADVFVRLGWNPNKKKEPVHG